MSFQMFYNRSERFLWEEISTSRSEAMVLTSCERRGLTPGGGVSVMDKDTRIVFSLLLLLLLLSPEVICF